MYDGRMPKRVHIARTYPDPFSRCGIHLGRLACYGNSHELATCPTCLKAWEVVGRTWKACPTCLRPLNDGNSPNVDECTEPDEEACQAFRAGFLLAARLTSGDML